jgi:hypothetical protein
MQDDYQNQAARDSVVQTLSAKGFCKFSNSVCTIEEVKKLIGEMDQVTAKYIYPHQIYVP